MLDDDTSATTESAETTTSSDSTTPAEGTAPKKKAPAKKAAASKAAAKKTTAAKKTAPDTTKKAAASKSAAKKTTAKKAPAPEPEPVVEDVEDELVEEEPVEAAAPVRQAPSMALLFQAPEAAPAPRRTRTPKAQPVVEPEPAPEEDELEDAADIADVDDESTDTEADASGDDSESTAAAAARRRRRRGGRRRRKPTDGEGEGDDDESDEDESDTTDQSDSADGSDDTSGDDSDGTDGDGNATRRRRRRVRAGEAGAESNDDPQNTVTRVRQTRSAEDQITSIQGSTRLEAKKQRRRDGREAGRRRAPIVSEAEFLARRESVDRVMVIRQRQDLTQIAVLEDKVLVEHYVARESQTSLIGNVYIGRVQNVLPSMEAAFIDIGKGRNAVLYAGEVNWSALGHKDGQPRKIESVLSSGQAVLVQVTKDPVGHKGARLTSQVSLAGRFLVYVPDGTTSGISRKLPDTERNRLKTLLKEIVPDTAGVIVRTAAEGAAEDELTRDVERLKARWEEIEKQAKSGNAPKLLYGEPDLTLKVVRDLFTEDFTKLVIQGDDAWETVQGYVGQIAPDLQERLERYDGDDAFSAYRIDEQISKGLDRKVWLPSGGSLVIDRTEAMTVVDVNTGKFTGSGGNLEETVTKNNLEAAEEIVRQLRLRDIGGIIVVDFIDMVLESNRDLVLRRLVECLGRDRTRHQVAEVTSLGLVQMTRKRIGTGLLEAFSENCDHCQGRGVVVKEAPVESKSIDDGGERRGGGRRSRGRGGEGGSNVAGANAGNGGRGGGAPVKPTPPAPPTPKDVAAVARAENADKAIVEADDVVETPVVEAPAVETPVVETPVVETPAEPEAPAEPAAPKVVTRTRRAVSRPAGSTAGTAPEPVKIVVPDPVPVADAHTPVVEPPKVITRTRRVASRPAGATAVDTVAAPTETDEHPSLDLHVPVKKKGARKH